MIEHELLKEEGVLIVTPHGPLQAADFAELAEAVDPYIAEHGKLKGLIIYVEHFPGWGNLAGMLSHFRFVKDHHKRIDRVAAVTDDAVLSHFPAFASHFVSAEVKHFDYAHRDAALMWVANGRK